MRRMGVFRFIRVLVMMTMMVSPPKRPALHGRGAPQREEELADAGRAIGLVRKVAVIDSSDGKHPEKVEHDSGPDGHGTGADPNHP